MPLTDRPNLKLEPGADGAVVAHLVNCSALNDVATPSIETQLMALAAELGASRLTVDLGCVSYASSAALALCLNLHHKLNDAGGRLTLRGMSPAIYETFEVTGLTRVLNIQRDG